LREEGKEKRMIAISKYIISVPVEDIMIYIESCWIMRSGREGIKESNKVGGGILTK
jgi:hypothetical protein